MGLAATRILEQAGWGQLSETVKGRTMALGPVEVMLVSFPGSQFTGEIAPALAALVDRGEINIIDLAFVMRGEDDSLAFFSIDELDGEIVAGVVENIGDTIDLLNDDDLTSLAQSLELGSSAAVIVFEHAWARELAAAVGNSKGQVIFSERIPRDVVEAAVAAIAS